MLLTHWADINKSQCTCSSSKGAGMINVLCLFVGIMYYRDVFI